MTFGQLISDRKLKALEEITIGEFVHMVKGITIVGEPILNFKREINPEKHFYGDMEILLSSRRNKDISMAIVEFNLDNGATIGEFLLRLPLDYCRANS